jgi:hypothetical protein
LALPFNPSSPACSTFWPSCHEPYLSDPRPIVLVAAGGFRERAVTALWETVKG